MKRIFIILFFFIGVEIYAQKSHPQFHRLEPPFWFTGMKNTSLQILLYNQEKNISEYIPTVTYPGVTLKQVKKVSNPHYLFFTLEISSDAKAGTVPLQFAYGKKKFTYSYILKN